MIGVNKVILIGNLGKNPEIITFQKDGRKDENGGGGLLSSMAANMGMLAGLAGINITSNVNNEMEIMSSPAMMMEVVNRLGLDTRYERYDFIMKRELWEETLPVKLTFPKLTDKDGAYRR